jgi:hypothetical protein
MTLEWEIQQMKKLIASVLLACVCVGCDGPVLANSPQVFGNVAAVHGSVTEASQNLVVLLAREAIVRGLQNAYGHPCFRTAHYAVFHTGPSATGDIDGVLIHGAQVCAL